MEALYAKLYNRYTNLKKEKDERLEQLNKQQEANFLNCIAAADEMIEYLKNENGRLEGQVAELKSELVSIRSSHDEQQDQYERRLMEEKEKNRKLSEEIRRLQKLEHNECSRSDMHEETEHGPKNTQDIVPYEGRPAKSSRNSARKSVTRSSKKRKTLDTNEGRFTPYGGEDLDTSAGPDVHGDKGGGPPPVVKQPLCCQRKIGNSGSDAGTSVNCVFQYLIEFVVGMKLSVHGQSDELSILAHHQSSGYSFSLTWTTNSSGETELDYRVLSLGTFARIAPEWMKESLKFSTSMCSIFFERVSRVIKC